MEPQSKQRSAEPDIYLLPTFIGGGKYFKKIYPRKAPGKIPKRKIKDTLQRARASLRFQNYKTSQQAIYNVNSDYYFQFNPQR